MAKIRRILIECTHTYQTNLNSGIQRVVRNIIKESEKTSKKLNIECQPVIFRNGSFFRIDLNKRPIMIRFRAFLWTLLRAKICELQSKLHSYLIFRKIESLRSSLFRGMRILAIVNFFFNILTLPSVIIMYLMRRISAGKGDLILMLDSSWDYPIWPAVRKAKNNGASVGVVVYDLIPINHPQFCVSELVRYFESWYCQAMKTSDFFISISRSTRDEVRAYAKANQCSISHDMLEYFHLGCTLDKLSQNGPVRNELEELFTRNSIYIIVGTIEPRKNHKYLLDAFDILWRQNSGTILCIIGKIGWKCAAIVNRIREHPLLRKNLFMFNDLSDTELNYCYKHARALIFPSVAEGFGLPIVEALYNGLPALVSDIPVHREVGKDFCTYFDINNPACLAKIIINIEKTGRMPQVRSHKEYNLPTWKDSCRELFSKAIALSEKI